MVCSRGKVVSFRKTDGEAFALGFQGGKASLASKEPDIA